MAKPGYGKRSAPDQKPPRRGDFDHLPAREAYLASLLDQLCENAAMDAKTIAKAQPLYGQQAVRTGLMECTDCGVPGRPEALPGGLCRACDGRESSPHREPTGMPTGAVRARAAQVRAAMRTPQRA
ncbi:hypothetical protein [Streptomyces sp. NPDC050287]|uniref:hypothetical protein n=1 Tax=Streptomyces sp. NPDC050287 TaxID=3365608 RepID=UPI00379A602B